MTTNKHPNAQRLAEAIAARRAAQRWSHTRVVRQGGPTKPTQIAYERGEIPDGVQAATLDKFDRGLRWEPGTALRVLSGGAVNPTPDEPNLSPPAEDGEITVDATKFKKILEGVAELRSQLRHLPDGAREIVEDMTAAQVDILMDVLQ